MALLLKEEELSPSPAWDALRPLVTRTPAPVREHEILRISGTIHGRELKETRLSACREVLIWAQRRSGGRLPKEAWELQNFEYFSGGRNNVAVRIIQDNVDIWSVRSDDPDKLVPGRTWTNEFTIGTTSESVLTFSVRQLVNTSEEHLSVIPHVPGFMRQLSSKLALFQDSCQLSPEPWIVANIQDANRLAGLLIDSTRRLPCFVLSVAEESANEYEPEIDSGDLARATLGTAHVAVLPAAFTWALTARFGKNRSVFNGAVRAYLPGFNTDASPYAHRLVLADRLTSPEEKQNCQSWMRSLAATESLRRSRLGTDVLSFSAVRYANLRFKQQTLELEGASDAQKLSAANARITALEAEIKTNQDYEALLHNENEQLDARARAAESLQNAATFRIQQLLEDLKNRGQILDHNLQLPASWKDFEEWCDQNLVGRVVLAPPARSGTKKTIFEDFHLAARCLLWLANQYRDRRLSGGGGTLRDATIEPGIKNCLSGGDEFKIWWQGQQHSVDWHIKNGGNTRDPKRCLRIYYFWDTSTQQVIVADMPEHRVSDAT